MKRGQHVWMQYAPYGGTITAVGRAGFTVRFDGEKDAKGRMRRGALRTFPASSASLFRSTPRASAALKAAA